MVIEPKIWGFLCTTAHPVGCAANVADQIRVTQTQNRRAPGPKRALVIGASTGYGLAARITAAFGYGAATLGVFSEKQARGRRPASAGWYNAAAFEQQADAAGLTNLSINGDAFSDATREHAIDLIKTEMGGSADLVVYSLAAPTRRLPDSGEVVHTAIKPIGTEFFGPTINTDTDRIVDAHIEPASDAEIEATRRVMGGEDWALWLDALAEAGVLADNAKTVAFSYLGPEVTRPIYRDGTIGRAKQDLEATASTLRERHASRGLDARVAVLKSIVTQASAAIPVIPLYLSLVSRVMKGQGLQEGAIEQQNRLFRDALYPADDTPIGVDDQGRIRLDDRELSDPVQQACRELWPQINNETLSTHTDYAGYKHDFLRLFGFDRADIDYAADVEAKVAMNCRQV